MGWQQAYRNLDAPPQAEVEVEADDEEDLLTEEDLIEGLAQVAVSLPDSVTHVRLKPPCEPCAAKAAAERRAAMGR